MKLKMFAVGVAVLCVAVIIGVFALTRSEPETLVFGVPPGETADLAQLRGQLGSVSDALSDALGIEIEMKLTTSYAAVIEGLRNGTIDMARVGSSQYVLVRDDFDLRPVAWDIRDGKTSYTSVLLGRPGIWDEPFTMDQLRGKTVAFVDAGSTSGYIAPMTMILEAGLTLDDLDNWYFSTTHPIGIEALLNGQVDVAATSPLCLSDVDASGRAGDYVILIESPPMPIDVWVVGPGVDAKMSDRIAAAIVDLPPEAFEGSLVDGLAPIRMEAFEFNEAMLRAIGEK